MVADTDLTDFSTDPAAEAESAGSSMDPAAEITFNDPVPETAVTTYAQAANPLTGPSHISENERERLPVPGNAQTLAAASYQGSTASSLDSRQTGAGQPASANGRAGSEDRQPVSGRTNGSPAASYRENAGKTEGVFLLSAKAAQKLETGLTGDGAADLYDPFQDPALADTYGLLMQEARLRASPSGSAAAASGKPSAGSAPENSLAGFLAALLAVMAVTAGAVTRKVRFRNSLR